MNDVKMDGQLVELAGRNWLVSQLLQAGLEVARPERDRGIDLIAYADLDHEVADFVACPIQMKASTTQSFSVYKKYAMFRRLILAYVWNLGDPTLTQCYALTYPEAVGIATAMGWTKTDSWLTGAKNGTPGYATTKVSAHLSTLLGPFNMTPEKWRAKVLGIVAVAPPAPVVAATTHVLDGEGHLPPASGPRASQRGLMRDLFEALKGDEERVVEAYAAAETTGAVQRASNAHKMEPVAYARALLADGLRKGWVR